VAAKRITHLSADERKPRVRTPADERLPQVTGGRRPVGFWPEPVALFEEQNITREPDLVPVRHGRMIVSP
jgi:hypothetical protein